MKNLLDTHTLLWFVEGDERLSVSAKKAIEDANASNFVSIASLWEIAIKVSLGKLELKAPFSKIETQIIENGFQVLPVTFKDTVVLSTLPFHHRDPFDRIIISQCISEERAVLSKDRFFKEYGITVVW